MEIDIVTILYQSEKWLKGYLDALLKVNYPLERINLILIDNKPSVNYDATLKNHSLINRLGSFQFIANTDNVGFGMANNQGAKLGKSPYVFFLNIDTEVTQSTFAELDKYITQSASSVGAWELRQFPYEHPKVYNPVTQYVSWASAAALVVKRNVFETLGGFDEKIFMYAEDVDLSWNIRLHGYNIRYCPKSIVYHYSYSEADEVKPTQFYYSLYNNLMLRYKYGSIKDIIKGYSLLRQVKNSPDPVFKDQKARLTEMLKDSFKKGFAFRHSKVKDVPQNDFKPSFLGFDYEIIRKGAFYKNTPCWELKTLPKVSIIVRTHKRPLVLENAIISLLNQTYPNIEIVVVEDGQNTAQNIIDKYLPSGILQYYYTGENKGRSHAGNLGMSKATGEYLCFLDDDDLVYADHLEALMHELQIGNYNMVHAPAFCVTTETKSTTPYIFKEVGYEIRHDYPADKEELLNNNLFPIQSVLFEKKLFDTLGGFDETIDFLEDWALWLKYVQDTKVGYIDKVTSLYRVPANAKQFKKRLSELLSTRNYVLATYAHNYISEKNQLEIAVDHLKTLTPIDPLRVKKHVDSLLFGFNCLSINGWAVVDKKTHFDNIYLKILINNDTYHFKLSFNNRIDIQRKFGFKNKKFGYKGDLQILGINGRVVPISLIFVLGNEFVEEELGWFDYHKIRWMTTARRYLS